MPAARTNVDLEEGVRAIWADVLGVPVSGPADDFFALGGNSLMATMVTSRLRHETGVAIPLRLMYSSSALADFTVAVGAVVDAAASREAPPAIEPIDRAAPIALSAPQERMWLLHQMQPTGTAYNLERALRLTGPLQVEALRSAFDELFARHESLRTGFRPHAGGPVQHIAPVAAVEIPIVDCGTPAPDERLAAVVLDMQRVVGTPFDLASPPLVRIRLFRLADDDHVLFVVMHHSVSDDWAFGLLMGELAELYNSHRADGASRGLPSGRRRSTRTSPRGTCSGSRAGRWTSSSSTGAVNWPASRRPTYPATTCARPSARRTVPPSSSRSRTISPGGPRSWLAAIRRRSSWCCWRATSC